MTQNLFRNLTIYKNRARKVMSYGFLKWWISYYRTLFINTLNFQPCTISREMAGEKFDFYIGNPTGKTWYGSTDADFEMKFAKQLIKPGSVVVDCGAHHGSCTILFSRWVGDDGKVISLEPMPDNVAIIRKNIELNGLKNVTLLERAVGSNQGFIFMKRRSNAAVSSTRRTTLRVKCVTLDEISREFNVIPSFLKIDVEGFECRVLEGAKSILSNNPAILLEVHLDAIARYQNTFEDLWKFINPNLYDIFIQSHVEQEPVPYSPNGFCGHSTNIHLFFKPRPGAWVGGVYGEGNQRTGAAAASEG
jgi:FkbM family methyltransferase